MRTVSDALSLLFLLLIGMTATASAQPLLIPSEPSIDPLALQSHRVTVEIEEGTARTKVDQVFVNHTNRPLEATYIFPLPPGAAIDDFALYINGKRTKGEVLEAKKAKRIYEDIVRRMADPGLVEWMGSDLFRARVFPVPARGEQRVELAYSEVLPMDSGLYHYVYPLRGAQTPSATTEQDFTLSVNLESRVPIRTLYSPSHEVYQRQKNDNAATVGFESDHARLNKDFELFYGVSQEDLGLGALFHRSKGEAGYFMLAVSPASATNSKRTPAKTVTFVVDTSGSMADGKMDHLKAAMGRALESLQASDHFAVLRFSTDVERWRDGYQRADASQLEAAKNFVGQMEAAGGTALHDALAAATEVEAPSTHYVVLVTDGRPTVGETDVKTILRRFDEANRGKSRLFAFGIGEDLNAHLLDQLAQENGGTTAYIRGDKDLEHTMTSALEKLAHPALASPSLAIRNVDTYAVLPGEIPDLFKGEQILVVGRYRTPADALVRVGGSLGEQSAQYDFETTFPREETSNAFIASLWAQRQVGFLLDQVRLHGETQALKAEIVQLATKFGIVTPYTSYLVVEPGMEARDSNRPLQIPRPDPSRRNRPASPFGGMGAGGMGSSGTGSGGGGQRGSLRFDDLDASKAEAPAALPLEMEEFRRAEGKSGVDTAKGVKKMKQAARAKNDRRSKRRRVGGVTLEWQNGGWVDVRVDKSQKRIRVRYLSDAYFELLDEIPELRELLAVGDRVTLKRGSMALEVDAQGKTKLSPAEMDALR